MKKILSIFLFLLITILEIPAATPSTVIEVMDVLSSGAQFDYIGESISQLEHALQCAKLAQDSGANSELILAALLHDIGHLCAQKNAPTMSQYGICEHENIGANYLASQGFSSTVVTLVRSHIDAKRYLAYHDPSYLNKLSIASQRTLEFQGGPMSAEEAACFEQLPFFKEKLLMRHWDEEGKVANLTVPNLESYKELLTEHLSCKR